MIQRNVAFNSISYDTRAHFRSIVSKPDIFRECLSTFQNSESTIKYFVQDTISHNIRFLIDIAHSNGANIITVTFNHNFPDISPSSNTLWLNRR